MTGLLLAGCQQVDVAQPADSADSSESAAAGSSLAVCDSTPRVECIRDSQQAVHGVLYHGGEGDSAGSYAVWDPGGPGVELPDSAETLIDVIPEPLEHTNVLLVVEPWLRHPPAEPCLAEAGGDEEELADCNFDSLTSTSADILETLALTSRQTGLDVSLAYLQSFGATRSMPALVGRRVASRLDGIVLESPSPPPGLKAAHLLSARTTATIRVLQRFCGTATCKRAVGPSTRMLGREGLADTTGREFALGLFAAATLPDRNATFLRAMAREVTSSAGVSEENATRLRLLGRQYAGLRGDGSLAPTMLAHWADVCPRFTHWGAVASIEDPLARALGWLYRGCKAVQAGASDDIATMPRGCIQTPILLVVSQVDSVIPPELQQTWGRKSCGPLTKINARHHFSKSPDVVSEIDAWITATDDD